MPHRTALYTAVLGGYENPADVLPTDAVPPLSHHPGTSDCFRFSDAPMWAEAPGWTSVQAKPRFPADRIRSARAIKILGHPVLLDYDVTVWVDNRIHLKVRPAELVRRFLPDESDIAVPIHSFRSRLSDEFTVIIRSRVDDPRRVREQQSAYQELAPHLGAERVYWTGILIRRNTPLVRGFDTFWWEQVLRYSRRDQLSFPYALHAYPDIKVSAFAIDNLSSAVHVWRKPQDVGRSSELDLWQPPSLSAEIHDAGRMIKSRLRELP